MSDRNMLREHKTPTWMVFAWLLLASCSHDFSRAKPDGAADGGDALVAPETGSTPGSGDGVGPDPDNGAGNATGGTPGRGGAGGAAQNGGAPGPSGSGGGGAGSPATGGRPGVGGAGGGGSGPPGDGGMASGCAGPCWQELPVGKKESPFTDYAVSTLAVSAALPGTVYAGSEEGLRLWKSTDHGQSWTQQIFGISVGQIVIDPVMPETVYATESYHVRKTVTGGATWVEVGGGGAAGVPAIAIDPRERRTVFIGVEHGWGIYKSTDGATTFSNVLAKIHTTALTFVPGKPDTMYAGARDYDGGEKGGIWRSLNSGGEWSRVFMNANVQALSATPTGTVFAGTAAEGLWRSNDGVSFVRVAGLAPTDVRAIAIAPDNPSIMYLGTWEQGVWKSSDGGGTFVAMNEGLTNTFVLALVVDAADPRILYAGTKGNGVFRWR